MLSYHFGARGVADVAMSYDMPTSSMPGADQGPTVTTCGEACKKWERVVRGSCCVAGDAVVVEYQVHFIWG